MSASDITVGSGTEKSLDEQFRDEAQLANLPISTREIENWSGKLPAFSLADAGGAIDPEKLGGSWAERTAAMARLEAPNGVGGKLHWIDPEPFEQSGKDIAVETDKTGRLADNPEQNSFVDKVVHAISGNEGSFTTLTPNDAGHGVSLGIMQWNQKVGQLPELLRAWNAGDPEDFKQIFGTNAGRLLNEHWVRSHNIARDKPLMHELAEALENTKLQDIQLELARNYVKDRIQIGYNHGFRSELGLALVCDMLNQIGEGGLNHALRRAGLSHTKVIHNESAETGKLAASTQRAHGHQRYSHLKSEFSPTKTAELNYKNDTPDLSST